MDSAESTLPFIVFPVFTSESGDLTLSVHAVAETAAASFTWGILPNGPQIMGYCIPSISVALVLNILSPPSFLYYFL